MQKLSIVLVIIVVALGLTNLVQLKHNQALQTQLDNATMEQKVTVQVLDDMRGQYDQWQAERILIEQRQARNNAELGDLREQVAIFEATDQAGIVSLEPALGDVGQMPAQPIDIAAILGEQADTKIPAKSFGDAIGGMLKQMMEDPDTQDMMRRQQAVGINMMYDTLFKELGMSDEDTEKLRQLMIDHQMTAMSQMQGSIDAEAIASGNAESEDEIRDFLGDDLYEKYEMHNRTMGDRMMLQQFQQQLARSDHPLQPGQYDDMLNVITEQHETMELTDGFGGPHSFNPALVRDEERVERFIKEREALDESILDRATDVLSEEQLDTLRDSQERQRGMIRFGMKMGRSMFGQDDPETPE
jgi:hypothetical protein